jgi:hypothetical protein
MITMSTMSMDMQPISRLILIIMSILIAILLRIF